MSPYTGQHSSSPSSRCSCQIKPPGCLLKDLSWSPTIKQKLFSSFSHLSSDECAVLQGGRVFLYLWEGGKTSQSLSSLPHQSQLPWEHNSCMSELWPRVSQAHTFIFWLIPADLSYLPQPAGFASLLLAQSLWSKLQSLFFFKFHIYECAYQREMGLSIIFTRMTGLMWNISF